MGGPLAGVRVVELAGIGPAPFAGMLLADLGAYVLRLQRPDPGALAAAQAGGHPRYDVLGRGRHTVTVDLKAPGAADLVLRLAARAEVLIEGFRPGVAERLGIGPAEVHTANPAPVYGPVTGWGPDSPPARPATPTCATASPVSPPTCSPTDCATSRRLGWSPAKRRLPRSPRPSSGSPSGAQG